MRENYNLVISCQDTAEQLRLRPSAGKPGKGAEVNQEGRGLAADQRRRFPRPGLLGSPWPKELIGLGPFPHTPPQC